MSSRIAARQLPSSGAGGGVLDRIRATVGEDLRGVDRVIVERLHSRVDLVNEVSRYIIGSGGKRLRPLLVLLGARAAGYRGNRHLELAAVVEFIHTATLLHDDVVDASDLRRGRQTANSMFGNPASVLVGDFLYSRAFQMMVEVRSMRIMEIMAETTNAIAEGEVMQLVHCRNPSTTEERYLEVIRAKTAKLFEAAARVGAVLAEAPAPVEAALARYGLHLGIAYQLVDDVLDYQGSPDEIGKNVGDDLAEGKPTLPIIGAIRRGTPEQAEALRGAIRRGGREGIEQVLEVVESTGSITYTSQLAASEIELAIQALAGLPDSPYRETLHRLAGFCNGRSY
jgi:octaprenyl-diphosphate synthase